MIVDSKIHNPITTYWIDSAEQCFYTAMREYSHRKFPSFCASCYYCRYSAELYLKALLQEHGVAYGRLQNVVKLASMLIPFDNNWKKRLEGLKFLSQFNLGILYPGRDADKATAKAALDLCKMIRKAARGELGISE